MKVHALISEKEMIDCLVNLTNDFNLTQCIFNPTHKHRNTLDLMFTNNNEIEHNLQYLPKNLSHHLIIRATIHHNEASTKKNKIKNL